VQYIPIQTKVLKPPQDDLLATLDESIVELEERDIVLVTSKVVSIGEGLCVPIAEVDEAELIADNADVVIGDEKAKYPLTIQFNSFTVAASIDESNGNGYFIIPPRDPHSSAKRIWEHLRNKHKLSELGVIVADSTVRPMRSGTVSQAIGWWGLEPVIDHIGDIDLFGREIQVSKTNVVDSLAAGAGLVSGNTDKAIPVVIARGVCDVTFTELDTKKEGTFPLEYDIFYPLLKPYLKNNDD